MKISIASDHGGLELKATLVKALSDVATLLDRGPCEKVSCDYPDYAVRVAKDVAGGDAAFGILIRPSGIGLSMARPMGVRQGLSLMRRERPLSGYNVTFVIESET